jgi:hypothetical protein
MEHEDPQKVDPPTGEPKTAALRPGFLTPLAAEGIPSIRLPKHVTDSLNEPVKIASFGNDNTVVGAEAFVNPKPTLGGLAR